MITTNGNKHYVLILVAAFAVSIGVGAYVGSSGDDGKNYTSNAVSEKNQTAKPAENAQNSADAKENTPTAAPPSAPAPKLTGALTWQDLALGSLEIDDPVEKAMTILGEPNAKKVTSAGRNSWMYNSVEVIWHIGKITALISQSPEFSTPRGIRDGSTEEEVFAAYGRDCTSAPYNGLILYEYSITSKNGNSCLLRFAVRQSDRRVDYISIRIV